MNKKAKYFSYKLVDTLDSYLELKEKKPTPKNKEELAFLRNNLIALIEKAFDFLDR